MIHAEYYLPKEISNVDIKAIEQNLERYENTYASIMKKQKNHSKLFNRNCKSIMTPIKIN